MKIDSRQERGGTNRDGLTELEREMVKKIIDVISLTSIAGFLGVVVWLAVWGASPHRMHRGIRLYNRKYFFGMLFQLYSASIG